MLTETMTEPSTKQILLVMLQENTGAALCDSGGAYGRNWEKNKGRDFESEPAATVDFRYGIDVSINVFHWLEERLEFSPELDKEFFEFCADPEREDSHWPELMADWFKEKGKAADVGGIYGDGEPLCINTYNGEDLLSQVLQFQYGTIDGEPVVLLQIHGGCDVRGGYTAPRAFIEKEDVAMFENANARIHCDNPETDHYWSTDDAYHWYYQGSCGLGQGQQLEEYDSREMEPGEKPVIGALCHNEKGQGFCPLCGFPLSAIA